MKKTQEKLSKFATDTKDFFSAMIESLIRLVFFLLFGVGFLVSAFIGITTGNVTAAILAMFLLIPFLGSAPR